jgi:hypothetical protein
VHVRVYPCVCVCVGEKKKKSRQRYEHARLSFLVLHL